MAKLAINGHASRGKEVIKILEMLGGKNDNHYCGGFIGRLYFINIYGYMESCDRMHHLDYCQYTLEEFLEKFPYKVGDKVQFKGVTSFGSVYEITKMQWEENTNTVKYTYNLLGFEEYHWTATAEHFQPLKEETMEENGDKAKAPNLIGEDYSGKRFGYKIPSGYEFDCVKNDEIILKPKQPE